MEWLLKLSNAIDYIETNLDNEISYDEVVKLRVVQPITSNEYLPMSQGFHYPSIYVVAE
jgi:hypothetical protein